MTITRLLYAPPPVVFRAWTEPERMAQWWGPRGFTNPVVELDVRSGGAIRIDMRGPDGTVYPMRGLFREIVEPERLVFTSTAFEDAGGNPGLESLSTVTFEALEGKTKLTWHEAVVRSSPEAAAALEGMEEGSSQSLERLDEYLAGDKRP